MKKLASHSTIRYDSARELMQLVVMVEADREAKQQKQKP